MPVGEFERQVILFNLNVVIVPEAAKEAITWSVAQAAQMLKDVYDAGEAYMLIGEHVPEDEDDENLESSGPSLDGRNVILIKHMDIDDDGIVTILLQHGDASAADPALIKIASGEIRNAGKTADEGVAHAAHLVISTAKHKSPSGQSRALLERVPGLGRATVVGFLNRLLRHRARQDAFEFFDEEKRTYKRFHPKLASQQQMSQRLKADLKAGKLTRIEFITRHSVDGFEEPNRIVPISHTIVHKVVSAPTGQFAIDLIERAKSFARKHDFEEMQVRFRKTDTDQNVSPRFATDLSDARDALYSRLEIIRDFSKPLAQCPEKVVPAILGKMQKLLDDADLWK